MENNLASLLRDFAQATSNSVASNAAVPVDVLAWLLRKGGVNVPPNPVMGSDWLAEKGFTREVKNKGAGLAGDIAGMVLPFAGVTKAPQIAKGLLGMGENLATPNAMKNASQRGAIVWHGSPHKFDAFDSSKIGTGEGAQAYGHGLYLAESPDVAASYQKQLASTLSVDGKPIFKNGNIVNSTGNQKIDDLLLMNGGDIGGASKNILSELKDLRAHYATQPKMTAPAMVGVEDRIIKGVQSDLAELRGIRGKSDFSTDGSLYKVDLPDEHIARMLDWDKPLSQQAPDVRSILERLPQSQQVFTTRAAPKNGMTEIVSPSGDGMGYYHPSEVSDALKDLSSGFFKKIGGKELTAEDIYSRLSNASTKTGVDNKFGISLNGQPAASEFLRQQGIPGIKYLDGGSRGAGQGSQNFVIFPQNERLLKILERNGESVAPNFAYPQSEALKLAQQRAALPKSEGGLGLRADNTAMERADVMFPTDAYHGTNADVSKFLPNDALGSAIYTSPTPDLANAFASANGANVMPLKVNDSNIMNDNVYRAYNEIKAANKAKNLNKSGFKVTDEANPIDSDINTAFFNPDDIRSRFAAFDPWRRNAAIAATMGVAAPDLLANPLDDKNNRLIDILRNK